MFAFLYCPSTGSINFLGASSISNASHGPEAWRGCPWQSKIPALLYCSALREQQRLILSFAFIARMTVHKSSWSLWTFEYCTELTERMLFTVLVGTSKILHMRHASSVNRNGHCATRRNSLRKCDHFYKICSGSTSSGSAELKRGKLLAIIQSRQEGCSIICDSIDVDKERETIEAMK